MQLIPAVVAGFVGAFGSNSDHYRLALGDYIGPKKITVIGQIIGSGQIDLFMCIESVIASISIFNYRKFIAHRLNFRFKLNYFSASIFWEMA